MEIFWIRLDYLLACGYFMMDNDAVLPNIILGIKFLLEVSYSSLALFDIIGGLLIGGYFLDCQEGQNKMTAKCKHFIITGLKMRVRN